MSVKCKNHFRPALCAGRNKRPIVLCRPRHDPGLGGQRGDGEAGPVCDGSHPNTIRDNLPHVTAEPKTSWKEPQTRKDGGEKSTDWLMEVLMDYVASN